MHRSVRAAEDGATFVLRHREMPGLTEHRYRTYWTHSPQGLFIVEVTPDGRFCLEALNPAHERATGLLTEVVAGRPIEDCLEPAVVDAILPRYRHCVEAGRPVLYEEVLSLPAGLRHWETSLSPVRDGTGRIAWLLGTARDVTERVILQQALTDSEASFRLLAETVPDIIFSADAQGAPDYRNRRYYDYTGIEPGEEPTALQELHPTDRARIRREWRRTVHLGVVTSEVRIRDARGAYRWFLLRARRLETPQGKRWFGVASDIHDVKAAAETQQRLNDRLESVLASISDCYYTMDRDWRITSVNPQAAAWFGAPAGSLIGADARLTLKYPPKLALQIGRTLKSGKPTRGEYAAAYNPGCIIDVHAYPGADGVSIFFRDVTEQHEARREVERARGMLQATVDALAAEVAIIDSKGTIVAVNQSWRDFIKTRAPYLADHAIGANYLEVSGAARGREGIAVARGIRSVVEGRKRSFAYTYCFGSGSAEERWYQVVLRRFEHEGESRTVVAHQDITDATLAHRTLRETAEKLLDIQEEERRRVAVELHDSTGQHLVALNLALGGLKRIAPVTPATAPLYDDIKTSLEEAQRELRVFSYLLHPPYLEQEGLAASLHKFLRGFARRSGLNVIEQIDAIVDVADLAVRRTAFRIVQEAISNVHRHAGARNVKVELTVDGRLRLKVSDDGRGLGDQDEVTPGVGIAGMRARVIQLGGEFSISSPGQGLVIEALLPLVGN